MTIEKRLTDLEQVINPVPEGSARIVVVRVPGEIPRDEKDTWIEAHPEAVSKIVAVDPTSGPRAVFLRPDDELGQ